MNLSRAGRKARQDAIEIAVEEAAANRGIDIEEMPDLVVVVDEVLSHRTDEAVTELAESYGRASYAEQSLDDARRDQDRGIEDRTDAEIAVADLERESHEALMMLVRERVEHCIDKCIEQLRERDDQGAAQSEGAA